MKWPYTIILTLILCSFNMVGQTNIMIRAKAKDAKFIGSSIGGARIIVREVLTAKILAEGVTEGATGDTDKIMNQPKERYQNISDNNTAGFLAKLDISKPTFIEVEAYAPILKKQATVKSTTQLWVIPGKHIEGDGIVLEIPGFVVDILAPQTHQHISGDVATKISANIVMMCGCPVSEGGIWDANGYELKAVVEGEGYFKEVELKQTEEQNTFATELQLSKNNYTISVYAFDPKTGNTGVDRITILVD